MKSFNQHTPFSLWEKVPDRADEGLLQNIFHRLETFSMNWCCPVFL